MDKVSGKLTVFFEDPFWVGVFERVTKGRLSVSKVTFGAEPKEQEVYAFVLKQYRCLRFSPAVVAAVRQAGHIIPSGSSARHTGRRRRRGLGQNRSRL